MMSSSCLEQARKLWNDLYDISLEEYVNEDEYFRGFAMVLHVMQLEFQKMKLDYKYLKEHSEYTQQSPGLLDIQKFSNRPPLTIIPQNKFVTPIVQEEKHDFDDSNLFNNQISEMDISSSKENDESLFINDSIKEIELPTSPTLNKSKHSSKKMKKLNKTLKESVNESSIVFATPISKIKRSKKLKQSTITQSYDNISFSKMNGNNNTNQTLANCIDNDQTYIPLQNSKIMHLNNCDKRNEILDKLAEDSPKKKIKVDNSYDCLPITQNNTPAYPYKQEAVRKKSDRMKLQGWDCADCERYYKSFNLPEEELKKKMNQCSKHRSKFNPKILTPKGFWNPDFTPTQEESLAFHLQ